MQAILSFLTEIFSQPAFLMGLIAFVGNGANLLI